MNPQDFLPRLVDQGFQGTVHERVLLACHTTFNIGGAARWLAIPACLEDVSALVRGEAPPWNP